MKKSNKIGFLRQEYTPEEDDEKVGLKAFSILYVEDDEAIREELARFLRRRCRRLHVAADGLEGGEKYRAFRPDIIVTDIRMPRRDGLEMIADIRKQDADIPIIVTTAHNDARYLKKCIEAGVDRYVFKPVGVDELMDALHRNAGTLSRRLRDREAELALALERENELRSLREEAERAHHAKARLLDNASHGFRTPLSAMLGFTRLAMEENSDNPELLDRLRIVVHHGEHLLRLVDEVLERSEVPDEPVPEEESDDEFWNERRLNCRILVAEDSLDNRLLIATMLRRHGARVKVVEDGEAAVSWALHAWAKGRPFDIVLMDMRMPILDGYAAARRLRERDYPGRIVALTAQARADDREKCLKSGCDEYITKPINRRYLVELLSKYSPGIGHE